MHPDSDGKIKRKKKYIKKGQEKPDNLKKVEPSRKRKVQDEKKSESVSSSSSSSES